MFTIKSPKYPHVPLQRGDFHLWRMSMENMDLYEKSKDFKRYVDEYCKKTNIPVEVALSHMIVKNVARHYIERGNQ